MRISFLSTLVVATTVSGILPNFGFDDETTDFENGIAGSEVQPVFENLNPSVNRVPKSALEGVSIEELTKKLQDKVDAISRERSAGGVPAKSMRELEELMSHPTWLTDTSHKRVDPVMSKSRRVFVAPAAGEQWRIQGNEDPRDHIREVITKFQTLKPKQPITDNRITKFVFTHDADLATSKTVQEHNREVQAAFMDFNKKLEETLNVKNRKAENERAREREMLDRSFSRVVSFLDKHINKLKEEVPHKQVCRKHKSHTKDFTQESDYMEAVDLKGPVVMNDMEMAPLKHAGMLRFNDVAQTRDGLENILLGLDRPRSGPFKRHVFRKRRRSDHGKSRQKYRQ